MLFYRLIIIVFSCKIVIISLTAKFYLSISV